MSKINVGYYFREGLSSIGVHGFMSFAAVTVIAACFLITGTFSLVAYNLDLLISGLESQNEIIVYIDEKMTREEAQALQKDILKIENVEKTVFVSREQGFENYLKSLGEDAYVMEDLRENNPLRDGYRVVMKDVSKHAETVSELEKIVGVAKTSSQKEISDRLIQIRRVVNAVSLALIGLLGAVSVFIISNTVKLAMFSRREEIGIMKMVGATNGFIRAPFLVEGMTLGLLAAIVAFAAQWGVYSYIARELVESTAIFNMVSFPEFATRLLGILCGAGIVMGVSGSLLTIRKFLKV